jgi:PAS domain S-box-containing protein
MGDSQVFVPLLYNAAVLIAMVVLVAMALDRGPLEWQSSRARRIYLGLAVGVVATAVMAVPVRVAPGVIFDVRTVPLILCGLFFGVLPTAVACAITLLEGLASGNGLGAEVGSVAIGVAGLAGVAWRGRRARQTDNFTWSELYMGGFVVLAGMLIVLGVLAMLRESAYHGTLNAYFPIALAVMVVHPLATAATGSLVAHGIRRELESARIAKSEACYRSMFENNHAVALLVDPHSGASVDANPAAAQFYSYAQDRLRSINIREIPELPAATLVPEVARSTELQINLIETWHRLANGQARDIDVYRGPLQVGARAEVCRGAWPTRPLAKGLKHWLAVSSYFRIGIA